MNLEEAIAAIEKLKRDQNYVLLEVESMAGNRGIPTEFMAVMKKAMEVYIHNNSPSDDCNCLRCQAARV